MRIHALEATGGHVYSQIGIYIAKPGTPKAQLMASGGTDYAQFAAVDPTTGKKVSLARGSYKIVMVGQARDDNVLALLVK